MAQQISYEAIQGAINDIILYYKERAMNLERCLKSVFNPNLYYRFGDWGIYQNKLEATRSRDNNGVFTCYRVFKKRSLRQAVIHFITGMDFDVIRELPEGTVQANAFAMDHEWAWTTPKRKLRVTSQDYLPIHNYGTTVREWENFAHTISTHETEIRTMLETASPDDLRNVNLMFIAAQLIDILWKEGKQCRDADKIMQHVSDLEAKLMHKSRFSNHA